jgi:hypothetical protein
MVHPLATSAVKAVTGLMKAARREGNSSGYALNLSKLK